MSNESRPLNTFNNPQAMIRKMTQEGKMDMRGADAPFELPDNEDEEEEEEEEGEGGPDGDFEAKEEEEKEKEKEDETAPQGQEA